MTRTVLTRLLFAAALLAFHRPAFAQLKVVAQSPGFERPDDCNMRMLSLADGSTAFITISGKEGIHMRVYDSTHTKLKFMRNFKPRCMSEGKFRGGKVNGIFPIGGDLVFFIQELEGTSPVLHRIVIDGTTGAKKTDEALTPLAKIGVLSGYAMAFGGVDYPEYVVRKDDYSDNYAVLLYNSFEKDRNRVLKVIHYSSTHQVIDSNFFPSPEDGKYKYLSPVDIIVMGGKHVDVLINAYNTGASGGKESKVFIGRMSPGESQIRPKLMDLPVDKLVSNGIIRYNPVSKQYVLLWLALAEDRDRGNSNVTTYSSIFTFIDPEELRVTRSKPAVPGQVMSYASGRYGKKYEYNGLPENLIIRPDGKMTAVFEETSLMTTGSGQADVDFNDISGARVLGGRAVSYLSDPAVATFDATGKELNSHLLLRSHKIEGLYANSLYRNIAMQGAIRAMWDNEMRLTGVALTNQGDYLLFNDIAYEDSDLEKRKIASISGLGECDPYMVSMAGSDIVPARRLLGTAHKKRNEQTLYLTGVMDVDAARGTIATLKYYHDEGKEKLRLVWLQPE